MGHARLQLARRHRFLLDDLADGVDRAAGAEGRPADQQLVQDCPQGINVGGWTNLAILAFGLFGGHVTGSAKNGTALRLGNVLIHALGQAEIRDLGRGGPRPVVQGRRHPYLLFPKHERLAANPREENVRGLEVAMDDATLVGDVHCACQRFHQLGSRPRRRRTLLHALLEAAAFDELEREIGPAFVLTGFVDLDNVGVLQLGDRFRLGTKPGEPYRAGMRPREDHFQRNQALQPHVPGLVDHAHAATAEFLQNLISRHHHALKHGRAGAAWLPARCPARPSPLSW